MEELKSCIDDLIQQMKICVNNKTTINPRDNLGSVQNLLVRLGSEISDDFTREETSTMLADKKVCQTMSKFLQQLSWMMVEKNTFEVVQLINKTKHMMYNVLLQLCCSSQQNLKIRLVSSMVTKYICEDMKNNKDLYAKNKVVLAIVQNGFGVLHKCADVSKNVAKLKQQQLVEALMPYTDPENNYIHLVLSAVSMITKVDPNTNIHTYLYNGEFFNTIADMLSTSFYYDITTKRYVIYPPGLKFSLEIDVYLSTLMTLAKRDSYRCILLRKLKPQKDVFDDLFLQGTREQKNQLMSFLKQLCQHSCIKCSYEYIKALLFKYGIKAHTPITEMYLHSHSSELSRRNSSQSTECSYLGECKHFLSTLDIDDFYLNPDFDRCFCQSCMASRGDKAYYMRGNPPSAYLLPKGWVKFALSTPQRADHYQTWRLWHVAFHIVQPTTVPDILHTSDLVEQESAYGLKVSRKTSTDSVEYVTVSPNISTCEQEHANKPTRFVDKSTDVEYLVQVGFQLRVKPGCYSINEPSLGRYSRQTSLTTDLITTAETDCLWSVDSAENVLLVGILVKMTPQHGTKH